jgi:hypothetical protein
VPGDLSFRWSNFFEIRDAVHRYLSEGGGSASSFLTTSSSSAKSVTSSSTVRRWKTHLMAPGGIAACLLLPLYRCMPLLLATGSRRTLGWGFAVFSLLRVP